MKYIIKSLLLLAICAVINSCSDDDNLSYTATSVAIQKPSDVQNLSVKSETITFVNITTGEKTTFQSSQNVNLPAGLYDCIYTADVTYLNGEGEEATVVDGHLSGRIENVEISGDTKALSMVTYLSAANDDFVFEEIFFAGTLRASGSQYIGDGYIKLYNNTDHVLYADGLAFCESKFKSTTFYDYSPDIRKDTMTIQSIYVVPGNGTDHPVKPGESIVICDTGIDHKVANPNSFDLSAANFEWYDVSTVASTVDIDSPTVPNLDKWYCYTNSIYVLNNQGLTSFVIARIPKGVTKEQFLNNNVYTYGYTISGHDMTQTAYKLPNSWIVDGVNCSVEAKRAWNILPPSVDAGWTHDGKISADKSRYFRSVRRKLQYLNADGSMHLKDTNNSTEDFNTECIPSIIELQSSAISADGTAASTLTYDGVTSKKK